MGLFTHKGVAVDPKQHVDMTVIEEKIQEILLKIAGDAIPTEAIVDEAADKLVSWLDDQIDYGGGLVGKFVDMYDAPVLRWFMHLLVHRIYTELVEAKAFGPIEHN